jgi:tRNA threonylcarbamoyladenosine biosynthesis protein TsaB
MNILALDTCFGACSAALRSDGRILSAAFELRQTGHAEALMPMIERVMTEAGLGFASLDRIAVTVGPGSFTGMRIGVAAARALALVTGAPVIGVPTLAAMAQTARRDDAAPTHVLVAVDARKDQVYAQLFAATDQDPGSAAVLSPQEAADLLDGVAATDAVAVAGSGAHMVAAHIDPSRTNVHVLQFNLQPNAAHIFDVALQIEAGRGVSNQISVRPLYLRPPDAKPQLGKSIPRLS